MLALVHILVAKFFKKRGGDFLPSVVYHVNPINLKKLTLKKKLIGWASSMLTDA